MIYTPGVLRERGENLDAYARREAEVQRADHLDKIEAALRVAQVYQSHEHQPDVLPILELIVELLDDLVKR